MQPREAAAAVEASGTLPEGADERFDGYGIMGCPFASGHVLAMRRFPRNSLGPGYTSVWHRTPDGQWAFYADVPPRQSCARYFGKAAAVMRETAVGLEWLAADRLRVTMPELQFEWESEIRGTAMTAAMNGMMSAMPAGAWRSPAVLSTMGAMAGPLLGLGEIALQGAVPNGQGFTANPYRMWLLPTVRASLRGEDFGAPGPVAPQAQLGDFRIPQRGVFALGRAFFDPFDPQRHS